MINPDFWRGRKVFLTGHTGFKGSWLSLWLQEMGADVTGYALAPQTSPNLYDVARVADGMKSVIGDVRDMQKLKDALFSAQPEVVLHLAAQPLVRRSYVDPVETYSTNVMGLVHLFEAIRTSSSVRACVNVTSDKCYENREWPHGYRENDAMGGYDPYSSSKGCAEIVTSAYRRSFFNNADEHECVALASARAGNVIGGGDWSQDRLIPDILKSFQDSQPVLIRSPNAVRPWQHVLEPLCGYLMLAERLLGHERHNYADGWNFGPSPDDTQPVDWIVNRMVDRWGAGATWRRDTRPAPHEAHSLSLDCLKAHRELGWRPRWNINQAIEKIVEWHKKFISGADMNAVTISQIFEYTHK